MKNHAIEVEALSKKYRISHVRTSHATLRDRLTEGVKAAFQGRRPLAAKQEIWVLRDISFQIRPGELVGIIGRNGAGKSTLLKILSRITEPTTGRFRSHGRVSSLLEVGTGFHPELTGRENIFLNGAIMGMRREEIRRKFDEIVAFAETDRFIDTPVKRYSSGMYVRLAFAVAAHLEPDILLIDEVLAVGDDAFQKKCLGKMGDVVKDGRTVIFVSHNMIAVNSLCNRAIWLSRGRIAHDGPCRQVVMKYLTESGGSGFLSEETWDNGLAPGNEKVSLQRISVRPTEEDPSHPLTMRTPFAIEVEYWNLVPDTHLHVTLHLYTSEGLVAFSTGSCFDPAWGNRAMPRGLFRSVCHVPGNLLNSGRHRFTVLIVKDSSSVILNYESRVSFDILDLEARDGSCFGREPGVVQPMLRWTTECVGRDAPAAGRTPERQFPMRDSRGSRSA